jgi:hypothetical protein
VSRQGKWEYVKAIHARYRQAARAEKGRILDEFAGSRATTGNRPCAC